MNAHVAITTTPDLAEKPQSLVAALGRSSLPLDIGWLSAPRDALPTPTHRPLAFRVCFDEVPFEARVSWQGDWAVLSLAGTLGTMPFTFEDSTRRRRLAAILAAAQRGGSGLNWSVNHRQEIVVKGDAEMAAPVTPTALVSSVVTLLLRCRPYLAVLVSVAAEARGPAAPGGIVNTSPG